MKIEEQVLSIKQMKCLQELGVDTSDASMCWLDFKDNEPMEVAVFIPEIMLGYTTCKIYPTYTIGDLIEKLPKTIGIYHLMIDWYLMKIEYTDWSFIETIFIEFFIINDKPLINTLYDCLCWIAEKHKEFLKVKK